jgi:predicted nucleic acid-binding protein
MGSLKDLAGHRLYVDTNIFVYALEDLAPWNQSAQSVLQLIDSAQATGITSELTLAECLVKPLRDGNSQIAQVYLDAVQNRPSMAAAPVSRTILIEAAQLRATRPSLKTPDAIHLATGAQHSCDFFVTNDSRFRGVSSIQLLLLSELSP